MGSITNDAVEEVEINALSLDFQLFTITSYLNQEKAREIYIFVLPRNYFLNVYGRAKIF